MLAGHPRKSPEPVPASTKPGPGFLETMEPRVPEHTATAKQVDVAAGERVDWRFGSFGGGVSSSYMEDGENWRASHWRGWSSSISHRKDSNQPNKEAYSQANSSFTKLDIFLFILFIDILIEF